MPLSFGAALHGDRVGSLRAGRWLLPGLLALLLAPNPPAAGAQAPAGGYLHTRYTVEDGLPTDQLTNAVATPEGYLWLGTQDGLVRYDGHRFVTFNTGNVDAFTDNRIVGLIVGPRGALWVLTESGALLRHRAGRFIRFDQHPDFGGVPISWIFSTPEGARFVTRAGLYRYREESFEALVEGRWNDAVRTSLVTRDGAIWLGFQSSGFLRIEQERLRFFTRWQGRPVGFVTRFLERPDGGLWIDTDLGLCSWDGAQQGEILPLAEWRERLEAGTLLRANHNLSSWFLPPGTLVGYDHQGLQQPIASGRWLPGEVPVAWDRYHVYTAAGGRRGTRIGLITVVVRDHEGGTWFATNDNGLHVFYPAPVTTYGAEHGLTDLFHYSVAEGPDGAIFAGGVATISRFDGNKFEPLLEHGSWWTYLGRDRAGELWFAGIEDLPHRFTGEGFEPISSPEPPAYLTTVWVDRAGTRWFGGWEGLYELMDGIWKHWDAGEELPFPPYDLFETRDGALWLKRSEHGLARFQDGRFLPFSTEHGLPGKDIRYLYEDADGILWLAVYGFGLVRVDLGAIGRWDEEAFHRAHLTHYRQRDGLFDDSVSAILEDDHGRLWLSSNRGIFWVRKAELEAVAAGRAERFHVASYGVEDGMRNREANGASQAAALRASDGRLWFPTMDGLVVIDPDRVDREPPPAVLFEQVQAGGKTLLPAGGAIELGAAERSFEVEVTTPVFTAPEQVRFRYRLAGYDDEWQETTRRRLVYTQVPGGSYTLQVEARNRSGLWSEAVSELKLIVEPFFYETWWFRALAALAVLLAVAGVMRLRVQRLLRRERELEALVGQRTADLETEKEKVAAQAEQLATLDRAKSRFFANISHEFRTPLTLLVGPLEDSLEGRHGKLPASLRSMHEVMLRNSRRLLRLVEQLLDLARFEAGEQRLDPAVGDLGALVRQSARSFVPLAERLGIELTCQSAELPALCFDREKLEKVLTNLISNACKFTPSGGRVEVVLEADDQQIEIAVRDTGSGISEEELPRIFERFYHTDERRSEVQASTGLGLSLARELARLHGGDLQVESVLGQGSTFTIRLPRKALALPEDLESPARRLTSGDSPETEGCAPALSAASLEGASALEGGGAGPSDLDDEAEPRTVLVVDDNADVRLYVASILGGEFRVLEAEDGEKGLEAARARVPDLIVSDVMMPGLDGHALARALKEDPMTAGIPVVLLTARAAPEDQVEGLATGVDCYLTKPFEGAVLKARVENLIALRLRLRDLYRQGKLAEAEAPAAPARSAFERRAREAIESRLADEDFGVEALARELFLSRSQLFRRLREEVGTKPTELIRSVRLEKAAQLLRARAGNVTEVAYAVGFKSLPHFTRCFRQHFRSPPSAFLRPREHAPA